MREKRERKRMAKAVERGGGHHAMRSGLATTSSSARAPVHTVSLLCMRLSSRQRHFVRLVLRVQMKGKGWGRGWHDNGSSLRAKLRSAHVCLTLCPIDGWRAGRGSGMERGQAARVPSGNEGKTKGRTRWMTLNRGKFAVVFVNVANPEGRRRR